MRQQPIRQAIYRRPIALAIFLVLAIVTLIFGTMTCRVFWQLHDMKPLGAYEPVSPGDTRMGLANVVGAGLHAGLAEAQRRAIEQKSIHAWQCLSCSLAAAWIATIFLWYVNRTYTNNRNDQRQPTSPP